MTFNGMEIILSKPFPRYVLPEEVIPGVPWPKGFRREINTWSIQFLGQTYIVPKGTTYVYDGGRKCIMRMDDYHELLRKLHYG